MDLVMDATSTAPAPLASSTRAPRADNTRARESNASVERALFLSDRACSPSFICHDPLYAPCGPNLASERASLVNAGQAPLPHTSDAAFVNEGRTGGVSAASATHESGNRADELLHAPDTNSNSIHGALQPSLNCYIYRKPEARALWAPDVSAHKVPSINHQQGNAVPNPQHAGRREGFGELSGNSASGHTTVAQNVCGATRCAATSGVPQGISDCRHATVT